MIVSGRLHRTFVVEIGVMFSAFLCFSSDHYVIVNVVFCSPLLSALLVFVSVVLSDSFSASMTRTASDTDHEYPTVVIYGRTLLDKNLLPLFRLAHECVFEDVRLSFSAFLEQLASVCDSLS